MSRGLCGFPHGTGCVSSLKHIDNLPHQAIYDIKEDRQGRLWIATLGGGLLCMDGEQVHQFMPTLKTRYTNPNANTVWPEWTGFDASRKTQRNLLTGDAWPADEIDDNPARYIQWGIKPAQGMTLNIDQVSLFVCGCGGNGMCCHIYFSTDNFETRTTIFEMKKMPANNMQYVEAKPVLKLAEDQELLVRVYPWYNGAATGKTICLSDLTIHGMAQDATATGIRCVEAQPQHQEQCYDLQGRRQPSFRPGLSIIRTSDGTVRKVLSK